MYSHTTEKKSLIVPVLRGHLHIFKFAIFNNATLTHVLKSKSEVVNFVYLFCYGKNKNDINK